LLSSPAANRDPLTVALARKARAGGSGKFEARALAAGEGWRVADVLCTSGPDDRPFEEAHESVSISLVRSGTFVYRGDRGCSLMSPGAILLGSAGQRYECSHYHGEGDRCLSFQFDPDFFDRLAYDAGASRAAFGHNRVPPLRALSPLAARAIAACTQDSYEEIALELAGAAVKVANDLRRDSRTVTTSDHARITLVLHQLESSVAEPHTLTDLARIAGLSRYHFLRTFRDVTGVTPHQWVLRARLREAAGRLTATAAPITEIALDVGFQDLSNFIHTFRAEFGVSPRQYRR
jgi:AraC family transcriptional regulator